MEDTLPFLARLGLRADADAGAIRRAYARELKLIDQARQAVQFQQLREAYEAALRWAGHGAGTETVSAVHQAAAVEESGDVAAQAAASGVYDAFLEACLPLREKGRLRDRSAWEETLRRHLANPRLLDLTASLMFEMKIAASLAAGWKPGNETLFEVAASVFEWECDAWRVQQLGEAGIIIARTLEQRYLFDCQEDAAYKVSRNVLVGLRLSAPPLTMRLRTEMPHLDAMLAYFPDLVAVTAGMENVARWRVLYAGLTPPPPAAESVAPIAFSQHRALAPDRLGVKELSVPLTIIVVVIALLRFYFFVNQF